MYANEMGEGCSDNRIKEGRDGFITIDELLELAEYLYKGLINLSNQRHPLSIYKGVKNVEITNEHEMLKTSSRTYFFDIETTKNGKPYLKIAESNDNMNEAQAKVLSVLQDRGYEILGQCKPGGNADLYVVVFSDDKLSSLCNKTNIQ